MSDTPRTDSVAARRRDPEIDGALPEEQFVPASFARLLERELSARPEEGERLTFDEWWKEVGSKAGGVLLSYNLASAAWNAGQTGKREVRFPAIWLRREGGESDVGRVVVLVEVGGKWHEVIREVEGCAFSHIVEPLGIKAKVGGTNTV